MNRLSAGAGLVAALLAGCAAAAGPAPVAGRVTGQLVMYGGAISRSGQQPGPRHIPGTVTFTRAGHRPIAVRVGTSGRFSLALPPGSYQVSGRTPDIMQVISSTGTARELPCAPPLQASITARHATAITVTCIVP
jgi:hypothetical protein